MLLWLLILLGPEGAKGRVQRKCLKRQIWLYDWSPTPVKSTREGGCTLPKMYFLRVFFLEFPREKIYTPRNVRGGGGLRWMGWTKAVRTPPPPSLIHFAHVLEFLGFPRGFKPLSLYTFYVRVGQPFRGHPQDSSVFHEPWGLYILRACVLFFDIHKL